MTKIKKSFSQIVPRWAKKLEKGYSTAIDSCIVDGQELDIGSYSICIVGEAYNFVDPQNFGIGNSVYDDEDDEQYCEHCTTFAERFASLLSELAYSEREHNLKTLQVHEKEFKSTKERFVLHWNKEHVST